MENPAAVPKDEIDDDSEAESIDALNKKKLTNNDINNNNDTLKPDDDDGDKDRLIQPKQQKRKRQRHGLVWFSCFYTFLYIGAFFGWGPMQLLLEDNGSFSSKCHDNQEDKDEICPAQTSALINVSFIAQTSQFLSPLLGQIADRYGPAALAYCMVAAAWTGLALLIVAAAYCDTLLYPSFICIALSCWMGGMLTVRTGMVFAPHSRMRSRMIILLNSLFDAGSITYLGLWGISEVSLSSISLANIVTGYFAVSIVVFGGGMYFWTVVVPEEEDVSEEEHDIIKEEEEEGSSSPEAPPSDSVENDKSENSTEHHHSEVESTDHGAPPPLPDKHDDEEEDNNNGMEAWSSTFPVEIRSEPLTDEPIMSQIRLPNDNKDNDSDDDDDSYVLVCHRTMRQQLLSGPFLMLLLFWTISVTSNMFVLVTTRDFLAYLGDDETGNKYLTIFTLLLPASLVAVPFTDETLHKIGFGGAFQTVNLLALAYNLIRTWSDNLNVQVVGFVLYSFFRSFLFGVCFSYVPRLLAANVVSKATGIMFALTGVSAFANIALSNYAIEERDGDFFIPNLVYTLLVLPCVWAAWRIGKADQREADIRHAQQQQQQNQEERSLRQPTSSSPPSLQLSRNRWASAVWFHKNTQAE